MYYIRLPVGVSWLFRAALSARLRLSWYPAGAKGERMDEAHARRYERMTEQLRGLIEGNSPSLTAAMATIAAILHAKLAHSLWTGFYFVVGADELHVGPYQGPVACQILKGRGACLQAIQTRTPVVVGNVEAFTGHIACDSRSRSEIVIPLLNGGTAVAVLDIDSDRLEQFSEADVAPLQAIVALLDPYIA